MVTMLKTVITAGTGTGANIGRPAAGKTGTSQDWRDAWFVGFTPDVLTAVWVGNDGGAPMAKVTGGELPAAIWRKFMTVAEKGLPPRDFPWLVAEPAYVPTPIDVADQTPYADEPAQMSSDGDHQADVDGPAVRADDSDAGDGDDRGPAYAGADPYARGPPPGDDPAGRGGRPAYRGAYDAGGAPDDADDPPPPPQRWRGPAPEYGDGADGPPPYRPPRAQPRPSPDSSADDDPRYRY
jgi:membrane peptidoglycan carboxypeptidase